MKKHLKANQFTGFNCDLIDGKTMSSRPGAVKLGASGVSKMTGFSANYNRPGSNPLRGGAGVSSMTLGSAPAAPLDDRSYSLYTKGYADVKQTMYTQHSNPKNPNIYRSVSKR